MSESGRFLETIEANEDNAVALQKLLFDDFAALPKMGQEDALKIADPQSDEYVSRQLKNLEEHPREYLGVRLTEDSPWLGFVRLGVWRYGDEANHVPSSKRFIYTTVHKSLASLGLTDVTVAGLHAFATKKFAETEPQEEIDQDLFDLTLERASNIGYKTIKCSVDVEDARLQRLFDAKDPSRKSTVGMPLAMIALNGVKREYTLRELNL